MSQIAELISEAIDATSNHVELIDRILAQHYTENISSEPRFWELDDVTRTGTFYLDPLQIIAVWTNNDGEVNVDLGGDNQYIPSQECGKRLMAWAKQNSQSIPEVNGYRPLFGSN